MTSPNGRTYEEGFYRGIQRGQGVNTIYDRDPPVEADELSRVFTSIVRGKADAGDKLIPPANVQEFMGILKTRGVQTSEYLFGEE
eukprot:gene24798-28029_t